MQIITYRMDKQQVLLNNASKYIQYRVKNHNRKEYEKECMHMYNCITLEINGVSQLHFNKIIFKWDF